MTGAGKYADLLEKKEDGGSRLASTRTRDKHKEKLLLPLEGGTREVKHEVAVCESSQKYGTEVHVQEDSVTMRRPKLGKILNRGARVSTNRKKNIH